MSATMGCAFNVFSIYSIDTNDTNLPASKLDLATKSPMTREITELFPLPVLPNTSIRMAELSRMESNSHDLNSAASDFVVDDNLLR